MRLLRALALMAGALPGAALACTADPASLSDFPESNVYDPEAGPRGVYRAWFDGASTRYAHGVLGDAVEPTILGVMTGRGPLCGITVNLDENHVFEDIAPRLADIDGDGLLDVLVVRSHVEKGAQLAVYTASPDDQRIGLLATTPYIGRANRWLAPVGAADLDGDGRAEIAYVDRPHLAKTLRIWRFEDGALVELAAARGLTNHRIGEDFISGGIRDCGEGAEILTANADWTRIIATRFDGGTLTFRNLAPFRGPADLADMLTCR